MLFSNPEVATYINETFEPVWQKVRDVPQITVDFGGGRVIKRTLHGNIATYVCSAQGQIIDILPGIYKADDYKSRLSAIADVAARMDNPTMLASYHEEEAQKLNPNRPRRLISPARAPRLVSGMIPDVSKMGVEGRTKTLFQPTPDLTSLVPRKTQTGPLGSWESLAADTMLNESTRRRQIHQRLATQAMTPATITKWLYREVLHADLDDPYLGLGPTLFSGYPFPDQAS